MRDLHVCVGPPRPMSDKQKAFHKPEPPPATKTPLTLVPNTLVTQCPPGKARGLEPVRMRAKGGTREPREMTRKEKLAQLELMKGSMSPGMYAAAKLKLGVR